MIRLIILALAFLSLGVINAQQNQIEFTSEYATKNKEVNDLLRFQDIELIKLNFKGKTLKNKNYTISIKEFSNGVLKKTDTIISSKADNYLKPIDTTVFEFKFYVRTQLNNRVKMESQFKRFSTTKEFDVNESSDKYALHDFIKGNSLQISPNKPTYIMGYFLPYLDPKTGWKKYCDVVGSKHNPEDWGDVYKIPSYFLIEIHFD